MVTHTIQQGETLSSIARRYKFTSWKPIWIFNTQVRRVLLSGDPDRIATGITIFIPRSEDGYDHLIQQLKVLRLGIQNTLDQERYLLEADYNLHQATRVKFDLAGDILTSLASIGLQARKASQMAEAAEKVTGRGAVAAEYLASKETEKLHEMLEEKLIETALDGVAENSTEDEDAKEKVKTAWERAKTTRKAINAVRNFSLQGGRFFLDVSDMILQYAKVSKVADVWLLLVHGETPETSYKLANERIGRAVANATSQLHDKILYLEEERDLLYHAPEVPGPALNPIRP
jgi:hypothetical protein